MHIDDDISLSESVEEVSESLDEGESSALLGELSFSSSHRLLLRARRHDNGVDSLEATLRRSWRVEGTIGDEIHRTLLLTNAVGDEVYRTLLVDAVDAVELTDVVTSLDTVVDDVDAEIEVAASNCCN